MQVKIQDWETWYLSDFTLFQANHNINYHNQLYFISVFMYTCIKIKLKKGKKRDGCAKVERYLPTFSFGCNNKLKHPWICLPFCCQNRRNYHRYTLSSRTGSFRAKEGRAIFLFSPVWRQTKVKCVKSSIFGKNK